MAFLKEESSNVIFHLLPFLDVLSTSKELRVTKGGEIGLDAAEEDGETEQNSLDETNR